MPNAIAKSQVAEKISFRILMLCYVESRLFNKTLMFSRICKDDSICYGNFLSSKYKIQIVESFIKSTESCCPLMNYVKAAY